MSYSPDLYPHPTSGTQSCAHGLEAMPCHGHFLEQVLRSVGGFLGVKAKKRQKGEQLGQGRRASDHHAALRPHFGQEWWALVPLWYSYQQRLPGKSLALARELCWVLKVAQWSHQLTALPWLNGSSFIVATTPLPRGSTFPSVFGEQYLWDPSGLSLWAEVSRTELVGGTTAPIAAGGLGAATIPSKFL